MQRMKRVLALLFVLFAAGLVLLWTQRDPPHGEPLGPSSALERAAAPSTREALPLPSTPSRASEDAPAPIGAAAPAVSEDDPPQQVADEEAPPEEEIEAGECSLDLGVYDSASGHPVAGGVDLWRLAVPGTPVWVAGDQLQAQVQLADGRALFERLPSGRYRVGVHARRAGAQDPPEFVVSCPLTRIDLSVEMPRRFRVLLDVRDESGLPLNQAVMHVPTDSMSIAPPDWSQRRVPVSGKYVGRTEAVEWDSPKEPKPISAGGQGFEIGEYLEATPRSGGSRHVLLEFEGRSSVRCPIRYSGSELTRLLAVSIPTRHIAERVRTRDGLALQPGQVVIEAQCTAVDASTLENPQDWRQVPIRIQLRASGYAPLDVEHRLGAAELPELVLERP